MNLGREHFAKRTGPELHNLKHMFTETEKEEREQGKMQTERWKDMERLIQIEVNFNLLNIE